MVAPPKQLLLPSPLLEYMQFCEVYCSVECCGPAAVEVHPALLVRKTLDSANGAQEFHEANAQLVSLVGLVASGGVEYLEHGQTPFWADFSDPAPLYWLQRQEVVPWLKSWLFAFEGAMKHINTNESHRK